MTIPSMMNGAVSKICIYVILQISAFYFLTFGEADCTIFAALVSRSMSLLLFYLLYNRLKPEKIRIQIWDLHCLLCMCIHRPRLIKHIVFHYSMIDFVGSFCLPSPSICSRASICFPTSNIFLSYFSFKVKFLLLHMKFNNWSLKANYC